MKTIHYSIIAVLIFTAIIIVVIEFPLYHGPSPMMTGSKLYQEDTIGNNVTNPKTTFPHSTMDYTIGLLFNGTQTSRDSPFYVKPGQNITLVVDVISDPANLPVTLYAEPHIGFTKTNGMDIKLSDTSLNTPGKVILYMSISKDASPNTYQTLVKANTTGLIFESHFYVKVLPQTKVKLLENSGTDENFSQTEAVTPFDNWLVMNVHNTDGSYSKFDINYTVTGNNSLHDAKLDDKSKSLVLSLDTKNNGTLTVTIPRGLLDITNNTRGEGGFYMISNGQETQFTQVRATVVDRTFSIPFLNGTSTIEIISYELI